MLILVAVSIQIIVNSNLIGAAEKTGDAYKTAYEEEANMSKVTINGEEYDSLDQYIKGKQKPQVGEYVNYTLAGTEYVTSYPVDAKYSGYDSDQTAYLQPIQWRIKVCRDGLWSSRHE